MKCIYCGNEINDAAIFCNFCGKPVGGLIEDEAPLENEVPEQKTGGEYETTHFPPDDDSSKGRVLPNINRNLMFIIIVLVIGICVGIVLRVTRNPQKQLASSNSQVEYDTTNGDNPLGNNQQSGNELINEEDGLAAKDSMENEESETEIEKQNEPIFFFENEEEVFYASNQTITPILHVENVDSDISWSIENLSVASVDDQGTITSIARGETIVTAVSGDYSAQCRVVCDFSDVHDYDLILEDCTWSQAYQECLDKGGHLVNINSQEEMDAIVDLIYARNMEKDIFYVGGGREDDSDHYYWMNENRELIGNALNMEEQGWENSMWMVGEPSYYDADVSETYMSIFFYKQENRWVWNDIPNDITSVYKGKTGFICEYE